MGVAVKCCQVLRAAFCRSLPDQHLPPERVQVRRDLRQHPQKGLVSDHGLEAHTGGRALPAHRAQS